MKLFAIYVKGLYSVGIMTADSEEDATNRLYVEEYNNWVDPDDCDSEMPDFQVVEIDTNKTYWISTV